MKPITDINEHRQRANLQCALRAAQDTLVRVTEERNQWQELYCEILEQYNVLREEVKALRIEIENTQNILDLSQAFTLLSEQSE